MQKRFALLLALLAAATCLNAQSEPEAGAWKTWFIPSGKAYRLPAPPPNKPELAEVLTRQQQLDETALQEILYWNAGAPGYRWQSLMNRLWMNDANENGGLAAMLLSVAIYDATVAAWDSKYAWKRPRPFAADKRVRIIGPVPDSPSYPCEYSVAAGVAVTIIGQYYPALADSVNRMAARLLKARVDAGLAYPSDTQAGFELGKKIAAIEMEHAASMQPKTPWDGKIPEGPGYWKGKFAMLPNLGHYQTVVLDSSSQFRPGPPPDYAKDMAELKNFKQTFRSTANAFFHASQPFWEDLLNKKVFEYNLQTDPPRAARVYALDAIATYDAFVACWDAKYAYWGIRPEQYDTTFHPILFQSPPFPGYPSGHAAISSAKAELYGYLFPADKAYFQRKAKEVAESRFQGGIHFRTDNEVALVLGQKVAAAVVEKARQDGVGERWSPAPKPRSR